MKSIGTEVKIQLTRYGTTFTIRCAMNKTGHAKGLWDASIVYNDKSNTCVCDPLLSCMTTDELFAMTIDEWVRLIDMYRVDNDC